MPTPPLTREVLLKAAERHLALYPSSSVRLRSLLLHKIDQFLAAQGGSRQEAMALLDEVMEMAREYGWLDDEAFARSKAKGLVRRGVSRRAIKARLGEKGVPREAIDEALDHLDRQSGPSADADLLAACALVKRTRLGPYRQDPAERTAQRQKDLARLARAGFRFDVARKAVDELTAEEIDDIVKGL